MYCCFLCRVSKVALLHLPSRVIALGDPSHMDALLGKLTAECWYMSGPDAQAQHNTWRLEGDNAICSQPYAQGHDMIRMNADASLPPKTYSRFVTLDMRLKSHLDMMRQIYLLGIGFLSLLLITDIYPLQNQDTCEKHYGCTESFAGEIENAAGDSISCCTAQTWPEKLVLWFQPASSRYLFMF